MPDTVELSPVDHDPFIPDVMPVDHDPFAESDAGIRTALKQARESHKALVGLVNNGPPSWAEAIESERQRQLTTPPMSERIGDIVGKTARLPLDALMTGPRLLNDVMEGRLDSSDPEAIRRAADTALGIVGGGMFGAERGALGMAGGAMKQSARDLLPMDQAARMERAEAMGFRTDMPVYHGSNQEFTAFDPALRGATTKAAPARMGVAVAVDPEVANEFAALASRRGGGNAQVYPLLHRTENPGVIHLTGDESNHEVAATLAYAWDRGHDAIMLKNYTTPGGQKGKNIIFVKDESQLRSPTARFDPARKWDSDLLAGFAGLGAVPAGLGAMTLQPVDHDPFAKQ